MELKKNYMKNLLRMKLFCIYSENLKEKFSYFKNNSKLQFHLMIQLEYLRNLDKIAENKVKEQEQMKEKELQMITNERKKITNEIRRITNERGRILNYKITC